MQITWRCTIMALDAISGGAYSDPAKLTFKSIDTGNYSLENVSMNITEVSIRQETSGNSKTDNDLDKGQQRTPTEKQIKDAITNANNKMKERATRCEFSYVDDINRISIKIIDRNTDQVIKEIPSEDTLKMIEKLYELAGLLVDEKR